MNKVETFISFNKENSQFCIHLTKISIKNKDKKFLNELYPKRKITFSSSDLTVETLSFSQDIEIANYFTSTSYNKRYGKSKETKKPKLKNQVKYGVFLNNGKNRILLSTLSCQNGKDLEIFKIYDIGNCEDFQDEESIGYLSELSYNPIFDYQKKLYSRGMDSAVLLKKLILNKIFIYIVQGMFSKGKHRVFLILVPKVLNFLNESGIFTNEVKCTKMSNNVYTAYLKKNFSKYWDPESEKNIPKLYKITKMKYKVIHNNQALILNKNPH